MIMLPEGATYVDGSSSLDNRSLPDPEIINGALTYALDNIPVDWQATIAFKAVLGTSTGNADTLTSKAMLIFDTPTKNNQRTPIAENTILKKVSETSRSANEFTLQPTFSPLDVSLHETDKGLLNALVEQIKSLENIRVTVTGHTDNSQVLQRSRDRFSDNHALSIGRATSVARYLMKILHLTPEQITTIGKGKDEPVASNKTGRGRALNRRVEIRVTADKVIRNTVFQPSEIAGEAQAIKTEGLLPGETWQQPQTSPPSESTVKPSYDASWLETAPPGVEWLAPDVGDLPSIPSLNITLKHAPDDKVTLLKDGIAVSNLNFDRTIKSTAGTTAISYWRGIPLTEGDNRFEFVAVNALGEEIARITRSIHYSSPPVRAELIKDKSSLLADGLTTPVIAVRLLDRDGHPAREGISGEFMINPPYRAAVKSGYKTSVMPGAPEERNYYKVGKDGVALINLDPTTEVGEVRLRLPFYQGAGEINARLIPKKRDWILVGFAEGTAGFNVLSGNTQPLRGNAAEEHLYQDGRVALYAKGRIDSKWLMTMAYDSSKQAQGSQPNLFGTINPGTYYTLYGDNSTQRFDAASKKKIYLKIERDEFYALFGDFNTNLTSIELSRYSRSITGLKSEYNDEKYKVTMFASQSGQVFKKDEIRGEGTSGLYRLSSRNIVINSEKIRIETRDRFRSEVILSSRALSRNSHYTINYDNGTLFFREPVFSTDENLNHVFIVVDFESNDGSTQAQVYGGRAEAKINPDLTLGVTHINEGKANANTGTDASLSGVDMKYQFTPETGARLEYAHSTKASAEDAYLAQIEHRSKNIDGKAYLRQVDSGFGLGQINNSENGTRKMGVEGIYRLFDNTSLRGNIYRQSNLATGTMRDFVESQGNVTLGDTSLRAGLRSVTDTLGTGEKKNSELITAGITQKVIKDTLSVRADREQPIGAAASTDFPARTRLGVDYKISADTSLFAEQEWANGALRDTQNTRVGLKTTPWTGSDVFTSVTQSQMDNTARTLANMGLRQRWKINPEWSADAGLERGKTLSGQDVAPLNTNVPFSSGTAASGDFTAASVGTSWQPEKWLWNMRLEYRDSATDNRWNMLSSLQTELGSDLGLLAGLQVLDTRSVAGLHTLSSNLRLGAAWRPMHSKWIILDRLDFIREIKTGSPQGLGSIRIINNMNANYIIAHKFQISIQYGAKHVREKIDERDYSGYTDLTGLEGRYDLNKSWDVGVRASVLHSWNANQYDSSYGASIGHNLMENMWLSAGYNFAGFIDQDFSKNRYTSAGPFVQMRMKFDQQSIRDVVRWGNN
ncbi:MAG: OmpA family protein [Gammaproteobacteria bacterium]